MKNIKYKYFALLGTVLLFAYCSDDKEMFSANDAVYFKVSQSDENRDKKTIIREDTLIYSFAYEAPEIKEYRLRIPVEIVGERQNKDRKYKVVIDEEVSTAKQNVHVKPLNDYYIMSKGEGVDTLEIYALRHVDLLRYPKDLVIDLVPTDDFSLGRKENLRLTIRVSDMLERPEWWDKWESLMGDYNYIKHQEWIIVAIDNNIYGAESKLPGDLRTDWRTMPWDIVPELMAIRQLKEYFQNNARYTLEEYPEDPNYPGERIIIPSPY